MKPKNYKKEASFVADNRVESMTAQKAFIALGSDLDHPTAQLEKAIHSIGAIPQCTLLQISPFYQTKPMGFTAQDDFINAVVLVETSLSPLTLLQHLMNIEQSQGRVRTFKNAPRTIDCDIVLFGNVVMNTPELTIPHPGLTERDFVLKPLLDIAPDACLPDGRKIGVICTPSVQHAEPL